MAVMTEQQPDSNAVPAPHVPDARPYPVLSNRAIIYAAAVLVLIGAGLAVTLLLAFGSGQGAAQLDAIKTAGTIVIGTGGAAALWLAARRQRTSEIALNQKHVDQLATDRAFEFQQQLADQNRLHLERVAAAGEEDAAIRRLNDLYLKAVEHLGSDKPVVRLGALFALERVGNEDPKQRQTVVDVVCAYLRGPFTPAPTAPRPLGRARPAPARSRRVARPPMPDRSDTRHQEREVRVTAQRLLARVLRGADDHLDEGRCWHGMNLDLIGATLIDLDFTHCRMHIAWFENATFIGEAWFNHTVTIPEGGFSFRGATFTDQAYFYDATFKNVTFDNATFLSSADFHDTKFTGHTRFDQARFAGAPDLTNASFAEPPRTAGVLFDHGTPDGFATE